MSVPDSKKVAFQCENGHVNTEHKSQPRSSDKGFVPVCIECSSRLTRKLVPLYECEDCGNVWGFTGSGETPTCTNCRGKRTSPVND